MKRFVADGSSAAVIESGLIMVLVGLARITAWMHVSASLGIPFATANTTGSVRSRELHRASRTRRLRRSEERDYGKALGWEVIKFSARVRTPLCCRSAVSGAGFIPGS